MARASSIETRVAREEIALGLRAVAGELGASFLGLRGLERNRAPEGEDSIFVGAGDRARPGAAATRLSDPTLGDFAVLIHPPQLDVSQVADNESMRHVLPWAAWLFGASFEELAELCGRVGHYTSLLFRLNTVLGADASICWTYEDDPESQRFRHFSSWGLDTDEFFDIPRGEGLVGQITEFDPPVLEHLRAPRVPVYHQAAVEKYGWYQMERHALVGPNGLVGALAIYYGPDRQGPKGRAPVEQRNAILLTKSVLAAAVEREWYDATRQRWEERVLEGANRMGVGLSVLGLAHDLATRADRLQAAANTLSQYLGPIGSDESREQVVRQLSRLGFRSAATPESVVNTLVNLDSEARYLKEVIGQLNRLSSSRSEKVERQDLAEAVKDLRPLLGALVASRAHLTVSLSVGSQVRVNTTSLARIVLNLVTNSLDWKARNISMRVGPASKEKYLKRRDIPRLEHFACIAIEDDGTGMSPFSLAHCFDAFVTERSNGTGLGLFVVDRLVKSLGGRMDVQSKLGEGTTMYALFPTIGGDG